jgi:CHASE2 domain-containing sensor protein
MIVLLAALKDAEKRLDNDSVLADSITASKKVVLPFSFTLGMPKVGAFDTAPDYLGANSLFPFPFDSSIAAHHIITPMPDFSKEALSMGHINVITDSDGIVRSEPLFINYNDRIFPSFGLQLTLAYLNLDLHDVKFGNELSFGSTNIPLLRHNKMLISFKRDISYYSFIDVINKNIAPEAFKDKIVIIAPSIPVFGNFQVTSTNFNVPAAKITANVIDNIIGHDFITRPHWAPILELMAIFFFGIFIAFALPHLGAKISAILSTLLLASWLLLSSYFFVAHGYWIKAVYPSCVLLFGYIIIISKRYQFTIE